MPSRKGPLIISSRQYWMSAAVRLGRAARMSASGQRSRIRRVMSPTWYGVSRIRRSLGNSGSDAGFGFGSGSPLAAFAFFAGAAATSAGARRRSKAVLAWSLPLRAEWNDRVKAAESHGAAVRCETLSSWRSSRSARRMVATRLRSRAVRGAYSSARGISPAGRRG
ncbi:MAG TPA: hypothetical protein VG406_07805 [Isosphaeraceae bacterium]|jgi:hypothetical protein|nr:hypothetical protein [Isosphaeraceae bacterium]